MAAKGADKSITPGLFLDSIKVSGRRFIKCTYTTKSLNNHAAIESDIGLDSAIAIDRGSIRDPRRMDSSSFSGKPRLMQFASVERIEDAAKDSRMIELEIFFPVSNMSHNCLPGRDEKLSLAARSFRIRTRRRLTRGLIRERAADLATKLGCELLFGLSLCWHSHTCRLCLPACDQGFDLPRKAAYGL